MKKRILSLVLVLCMVLPMIPLAALPAMASSAVDGLYYDSVFARDVVFGNVPLTHWYEGLAGDTYQNNYDDGFLAEKTDYETYITAFNTMVGFGNVTIDAGTVESDGFDAGNWYNDLPIDVVNAMNATVANGYITREVLGKAHKTSGDRDNFIEGSTTVATRAAQYVYSYTFDPTNVEGYTGPKNLPKMIIETGNQSDEKGSVYGTYYLIYDILNNWDKDPVLNYLRNNVILVIVPCLTPGGMNPGTNGSGTANQNTYWNANFVNINRNFGVNFNQMGGYSFVADEDGEWIAYETTVTGAAGTTKTATCYKKAEDGNGDYTRVSDIDGHYTAEGMSIIAESQIYTQNSGHEPFDQAEASILRDLIADHADAFYFTDYHTNTSGCLALSNGKSQWTNMNWQAIGAQPDAYSQMLYDAADWHIGRLTENTVENYALASYGWTEGTLLGHVTKSTGNGTANIYVQSQNVLATTLEAISGFPRVPNELSPNGDGYIHGYRYSPLTQKYCSEVLGNWLIAILGQYAYDGNYPTETYTSTFAPFVGNYPTIENLPLSGAGYDMSGLPATGTANGTYLLSSLKDEKGNPLYPLTFNGNWSVGYKDVNADGSFTNNPDNYTEYGVTVQMNSKGNPATLFFAADTVMWSTAGCITINSNQGASQMLSSTSTKKDTSGTITSMAWENDATIRYTAEYDGDIVININDLLFNANVCQLVVMHNGNVVKKIRATDAASTNVATVDGKWSSNTATTPMGETISLTAKKGDHIDFVNHNNTEYEDCYQMTAENYTTNSNWEKFRRGVKQFNLSVSYYTSVLTEVDADYSGRKDALNWTYPTNVNTLETFLTWYKSDDSVIAANGSLTAEGTYARINQDLITAGWIKATDSWAQAIEGYFDYLRAQTTVTSPFGWIVGAMEGATPYVKGSNFSPINRYEVFNNGFNLFSVSSTGTYNRGYANTYLAVSENYFEAQLAILKNAVSLISTTDTASKIKIPYEAAFATTLPKSGYMIGLPNSGAAAAGHKTPSAMIDLGQTSASHDYMGTLLRPHATESGYGMASVSYVVPTAMEKGLATLALNDLYYHNYTADHYFSLYLVSGGTETALIPQCTLSSSTAAATIQAKLAELGSFEVKAGDRIDLRFGRVSGASFMTPDISLDIVQAGDKWEGNYGKENTFATSYETFFKWYDGATGAVIANNGTVTDDDYMLINPYFTAENAIYKITADMTYREAIEVYKQYLRTLSKLVAKNNWQLVAMEGANAQVYGTNLSPIKYADILERENAFALKITEATTGTTPAYSYLYTLTNGNGAYDNTLRSPDVWVSEGQFEIQMQLFFDEVYYDRTAKAFKNVENSAIAWDAKIGEFDAVGENGLTFAKISAYRTEGNVYNAYEVPYAWNSNGGNWPTAISLVAQSETNADYKGMVLRPQSGRGAGVMYTVPAGKFGTATLYIDQMYFGNWGSSTSLHNNSFTWNVLVNGVEQFAKWQTSTENGDYTTETAADSARIQAINTALATLDLRVKAGDTVAFCVKYLSGSIYVSPSIEITITPDPEPLRRVQYMSGGNMESSRLVEVGTSVAELIAAYQKENADFAANGCYVNGTWYAADAELPAVGEYDILIDDFKITTQNTLSIGATYSMNVYLPAVDGVTAAGVKVYGKNLEGQLVNGKYKVTIDTAYAKDVLDMKCYYTPYYVIDGEERIAAQSVTLRAADMLNIYINDTTGTYDDKTKALAQAALDYATVAKAYFADATVDAEVVARLAGYDTKIAEQTDCKTLVTEAGAAYTFGAASLQIGETINFVLAITATGAADVADLQDNFTLLLNGSTAKLTTTAITYVGGKKALALVIEGVPESEFANAQTLVLKSGDATQATLTYSVKDYCIRTLNSAEEAEKNMIRAVYAIGQAAEAYEQEA